MKYIKSWATELSAWQKDLTKMYEEVRTAPLENFIKNPEETKEKGEYVVLVAKGKLLIG